MKNPIEPEEYDEILFLLGELKKDFPELSEEISDFQLEFIKCDAYFSYLDLEDCFGEKIAKAISAKVCKYVYRNVFGEEISRNSKL